MIDYKEKYLKYKSKYLELKYLQLKKQIKLKTELEGGAPKELKCTYCPSDWIYKLNPAMCQECYEKQNKSVLEYHKLQDEAKELIHNKKIGEGIEKLQQVINLRNEHADKWFKGGDESHNRFANEFLPDLIKKINSKPNEASEIWDKEFAKLAEPMQ
jgi:hypothetical protein